MQKQQTQNFRRISLFDLAPVKKKAHEAKNTLVSSTFPSYLSKQIKKKRNDIHA